MTRSSLLLAASMPLAIAGCCDEVIVARAFVGHKSLDECVKALNVEEAPVSILCPGTEVTICWGSKNVSSVKLTVSPDPDGQSSTQGTQGAIYLRPQDSTTVKLAGDCTSTTKQIQVIHGPTPATFDARWDSTCSLLSYRLDPAFVDPLVQTTDVTARWEPAVVGSNGQLTTCPTPPFLDGAHVNPPAPSHFFSIDQPHTPHPFSVLQQAINDWRYAFHACDGRGFKCDARASMPFDMTLVCPGQ